MPKNTPSTALALALALSACDAPEPIDALDPADVLEPSDALEERTALVCDPDLEASVGGLYYPAGWTCPQAIANAEATLGS